MIAAQHPAVCDSRGPNLRTTLQMKRIVYLLVFLACWSQFDDVLLPLAPGAQSAPVPDDDDEYIPSNSRDQETRLACRQRPGLVHQKPQPVVFALVPSGVTSEPTLTTQLAPHPLYVFMSLQR
jgi:hypothetical protein